MLAFIPARGGSKRIPKKNIRPFLGKPIIQYSIELCKKLPFIDSIVVSSDDLEILHLATREGAIAHKREAYAANDTASLADVLSEYVCNTYMPTKPDYTLMVLPCAPFAYVNDILEAKDKIKDSCGVMPVTTYDYNVFRALDLSEKGEVSFVWPENELKHSQDLPTAYHDAGQWYMLDTVAFSKWKRIIMPNTKGVVIPRYRVQDIDTEEDWIRAESLYKAVFRP